MVSHSSDNSLSHQAAFEQTDAEPVRARLKWFNAGKGFGFVIPEDRPADAFLHITQLQKLGVHGLGEGAVILCHVDHGEKGATVTSVVQIIEPGAIPLSEVEFNPANAASEGRTKGIVKWYKPDKGFGFIMPDDGMKDIFVHKTCLDRHGITELYPGQSVRVSYKSVAKGREATSISVESTP